MRELPPSLATAAAITAEAGEQMLDLGRFLILGAEGGTFHVGDSSKRPFFQLTSPPDS